MEFRDLKAQYLNNKTTIDNAIQSVLLSSHFIGGEPVKQLEEKLAEYVGVKHCITCANGTDALQLALMAWGIGENDAVFVPDFTFFSTAEVVSWVNAVPIFVDIERDTFNMSAHSLEEAIISVIKEGRLTPKAVIAVDLFGQPADFHAIQSIAQKYNILLLEDGAQGFGGSIEGKKACSFGDISTTSFFPAKPLGCYGDGGAIFTDNNDWAELIESYKVHGKGKDKYDNVRIGMNSRLDTIQAAVLLEKLKFFDEEIDACNKIAREYSQHLMNMVKVPIIGANIISSWAQYTICFRNNKERECAIKTLADDNIPTAIYYRKPMHKQKAFRPQLYNNQDYIITENVCDCCLSLPMHAYLSMCDIQYITERIENAIISIKG